MRAIGIVKEFVEKREPIEISQEIVPTFTYGEEN
jgi:hypothetical protein